VEKRRELKDPNDTSTQLEESSGHVMPGRALRAKSVTVGRRRGKKALGGRNPGRKILWSFAPQPKEITSAGYREEKEVQLNMGSLVGGRRGEGTLMGTNPSRAVSRITARQKHWGKEGRGVKSIASVCFESFRGTAVGNLWGTGEKRPGTSVEVY